ncbi:membrane protein insertion efficiency factor YidD [uncultured Treponema sp.]|uniref:membrane protein insertion efficiency factor YidD n=1 Tax=uncultured Treponema sp. TaxID=162155 RepID=UPI0025D05563|nr:membrane protein insertion efficiency factor YidD [uncultured Treponema sp.]
MKQRDFPGEEERELVRKYVMERPLYRPNITFFKAILIIISVICGIVFLAIASNSILSLLGFLFYKPTYYFVFSLVAFVICARWFAILAVKLYQHYASEDVRRRCLLKPTCSEYAIIVLKKYGFLVGSIKIWIRLNYKCRGNVYYIDEP